MLTFLKEVRVELGKVTFPSKDEVIRLTVIVIVISVVVGLYLGGVDFVFTKMLEFIIK